jgi:hypothetical protein
VVPGGEEAANALWVGERCDLDDLRSHQKNGISPKSSQRDD